MTSLDAKGMKILHLLWGFSPWREGGLVLYAEELMQAQSAAGHQVAAFFAGRRRLWGRPRLLRWRRREVAQYEIENSPLIHLGKDGTFPAAAELSEPVSEAFFEEVLKEFQPDLIHIHELAGLPFSLLDICAERGLPQVLTLHDYFSLCPTLNLFDKEGKVCNAVTGEECLDCCGTRSDGGFFDRVRTLRAEHKPLWHYAVPLGIRLFWDIATAGIGPSHHKLRVLYRRRREENLARFKRIDVVISQSSRTAQIYRQASGREDILVLHSSLSHIEGIRPRRFESVEKQIRFALLNGATSRHKGSELLLECLRILEHRGLGNSFSVDVFGRIDRKIRRALLSFRSVRWRGRYRREELDLLLDDIHVGIFPSLCEEVFGYVGIEFLAKGIPVIGNCRGGITDYVVNDRTGWINDSCSAEELADIMESIITNPDCILPLNQLIIDHRDDVLPDREKHFTCLFDCYRNAIAMHEVS